MRFTQPTDGLEDTIRGTRSVRQCVPMRSMGTRMLTTSHCPLTTQKKRPPPAWGGKPAAAQGGRLP